MPPLPGRGVGQSMDGSATARREDGLGDGPHLVPRVGREGRALPEVPRTACGRLAGARNPPPPTSMEGIAGTAGHGRIQGPRPHAVDQWEGGSIRAAPTATSWRPRRVRAVGAGPPVCDAAGRRGPARRAGFPSLLYGAGSTTDVAIVKSRSAAAATETGRPSRRFQRRPPLSWRGGRVPPVGRSPSPQGGRREHESDE